MSVFARGKRWVAQIHDPATGKARHVGTFDTRREAKQAEAKALDNRVERVETVGSFTTRWTRDFPRKQPSTNKHNAERVREFAKTYKSKRMDSITRRQARSWALEHPGEHASLRAMFADALRDDIVNSNPFADLGINRKTPKRHIDPDWMSEQDVLDLAEAAYKVHKRGTADMVSNAILVAAYTGIRPGELFALEVNDVRVNELVISKAVQSRTNTIGPPKNGRTRIISLPRAARLAIESTPRNHNDLVFASPTGRRLYQSAWHQLWNPVRVAAGREDMHFYELRHWCATHLLEMGLSPSDVAVQLGHTDGGVLVQTIYGHPSEVGARERILERLDGPQHDHSTKKRQAQ